MKSDYSAAGDRKMSTRYGIFSQWLYYSSFAPRTNPWRLQIFLRKNVTFYMPLYPNSTLLKNFLLRGGLFNVLERDGRKDRVEFGFRGMKNVTYFLRKICSHFTNSTNLIKHLCYVSSLCMVHGRKKRKKIFLCICRIGEVTRRLGLQKNGSILPMIF